MPTKKKSAAPMGMTRTANTLQTEVIVVIHMAVCAWMAWAHFYFQGRIQIPFFSGMANPMTLSPILYFCYAFLPLVIFTLGYWGAQYIMNLRQTSTGKSLKLYLLIALLAGFAAAIAVASKEGFSGFTSALIGFMHVFFKPALISTLIYVLIAAKLREWSDRLNRI